MRVCLINPPWSVKKGNIWFHIKSTFPHLGLLSLVAALEREGINVDLIDFPTLSLDWGKIEEKIKALHYDYFGITATTPVVNSGYRISRIIKKIHPNSKVIFGGVHATVLPEEPFNKGMADFVIRGEGEESLVKFLKGASFNDIPGFSYRERDGIRHVQPNGLIANIDLLPFPAYHKIDISLYKPPVGAYKRLPAINMITSRGCPGECTFCNSANSKLRRRSPENIFADIEILYKKYGIKEIAFYDDVFTAYPKTVMTLCDLLIKNNIDITWSCFANADCVTFDLLKAMKAAGCHQILYGIESASEEILKSIKKNVKLSTSEEAIVMTKKAGITVRCAFLLGCPGETTKNIDETIKYSIAIDPDIVIYNITTPFPGTEMFEWAKKNNYLATQNWDDYDLSEPIMTLPTIDGETLKKKYKQAFRAFYFRPKFIIKKLLTVNIFQINALLEGAKAFSSFMIRGLIGRKE